MRVFGAGLEGWEKAGKSSAPAETGKKEEGVLGFTMKGLDGKDVKLGDYKGKVVVLVNVASKCGMTPQYKDLEALYGKYKEKGLVVIGVPANEFGAQEPGTDAEIREFCTKEYSVTFPMLSKAVVKGDGICPLYEFLTGEKTNAGFSGEIKWNFTKFLVSREGKVVKRMEPKVKVSDEEVVKVIEGELEKK
ncbi:MAG: glutathione [Planctomycetota bacterium]|nr:MAG: glutathione [Planctomycetota bacterium]